MNEIPDTRVAKYQELKDSWEYKVCKDAYTYLENDFPGRFTPEMPALLESLYDDFACIAVTGRIPAELDIPGSEHTLDREAFTREAFLKVKAETIGNSSEDIERTAYAIFMPVMLSAIRSETEGRPQSIISMNALSPVLEYVRTPRIALPYDTPQRT